MPDTEPPPSQRPRRRMLWFTLLLPVVAILVVLATHIDNWSRDLTTNRAHTAPGKKHEPWETRGATLEEVAAAVEEITRDNANWELADERPLPEDSPLTPLLGGPPSATHHLVRTTGLMRYKDDLWLLVASEGEETLHYYAESRSRVGKGDLGQNPRNLAELQRLLLRALNK